MLTRSKCGGSKLLLKNNNEKFILKRQKILYNRIIFCLFNMHKGVIR